MSVPRVECHLARAQLKRYIGGATLPDEILAELERHLHACPDCLAEAQRMKEALMAGRPVDAPASEPPLKKVANLAQSLTAKLPGFAKAAPAGDGLINKPGTPLFTENRVNLRILATSGALALTLIAMSTILRDPTRLLGPKANAPVQAIAPKEKETATEEPAANEAAEDHAEETAHETEATEEEHETEPTTPDTESHEPNHDEHEPEATDRTPAPNPVRESGESRPSQGDRSDRQPTRGLSLPGRPTMEDSPVVTADSNEGVRTRPAPRPSNPPRTNNVPRRNNPPRNQPSTSNTPRPSNSQDTPRVTVYNPDGTKK